MPETLADRIEKIGHGLTATELADLLNVSPVTIYKQGAAHRIPLFHVGSCVRFDPHAVAEWLRTQ
jgi:excisionase family DNA binding protein